MGVGVGVRGGWGLVRLSYFVAFPAVRKLKVYLVILTSQGLGTKSTTNKQTNKQINLAGWMLSMENT